jgi:hypothetical protein
MKNPRDPRAGDIVVLQQTAPQLYDTENIYSGRNGVIAFVMKETTAETTFMIGGRFYKTSGNGWKAHCVIANTYDEVLMAGGDELRRLIRMKSRQVGFSTDFLNPNLKVSL